MQNYYYTFGSDKRFPYGRDDYVIVTASNMGQANDLFKAVHPNRPDSVFLNCAGIYAEDEFEKFREKYYPGRAPVETITLSRREEE